MAKKKTRKKKHSLLWFFLGMFIYAALFLGAAAYGLNWFWGYMEAYENSRAYIAIDAYMEALTPEHICDTQGSVIAMADPNLQSEEACRQILLDALTGEITYARKAAECTDTRQVYVLRCDKQVIGSFAIETGEADEHGFTPWQFAEESFDLSFLMGTETVTTTVPEGYPVYVNGVQLDETYVTGSDTEIFDFVEEYYEDYDLPVFTTVTYEAGPFLGETPAIEAHDPEGAVFVYDEATFDKEALIHNCSDAEEKELKDFTEEFLDCYVLFAGCANDDRYNNYNKIKQYVVAGSSLAKRMQDAVDGMQFAQSRGDEVVDVTIHHYIKLEDGRYLCDVTYLVDTTGSAGVVQTTNNVKLIIVESGSELLVESMASY